MLFFSFFLCFRYNCYIYTLVFISSTSSDSLFPIDLTFHVAIFSVSRILIKSLYKNTSIQIDTGRKILEKVYINQGV